MSGRLFAWGWCVSILALSLCAVVLAVLNGYDLGDVNFLIAEASAALVGALISSRQPRNPVGWFILGHALCFTIGEFAPVRDLRRSHRARRAALRAGGDLAGVLDLVPWPAPDGRPPAAVLPERTPRLVALEVGRAYHRRVLRGRRRDRNGPARRRRGPRFPNPLGIEGFLEAPGLLSAASTIVLSASWPVLGAVSTVSLVARFRRAAGEERQQIKWVVYAVVFTVAYFILGQLFLQDLLPGAVEQILFLVSLESLWIAIAVAILGYHLYDIDLLINRTLVYGAVTAVLAAVYLGTVIVLEYTFRAATGGRANSPS